MLSNCPSFLPKTLAICPSFKKFGRPFKIANFNTTPANEDITQKAVWPLSRVTRGLCTALTLFCLLLYSILSLGLI